MRTNIPTDYHAHATRCHDCGAMYHPAEGCHCEQGELPSVYLKRMKRARTKEATKCQSSDE